MAQYIKQEMPNLNGTEEPQVYYRMKTDRNISSKEQRLQLALEYLDKNGAMHIADYMELTGLSRTTATLELKAFRQDPTSGITFVGRGSNKVYVKFSGAPTD